MANLPIPARQGTPTSLSPSLAALLKLVADQSPAVRVATIPRALTPAERTEAQSRLRDLDARNNAPRGGADTLGEIAILLAGFTITARLTEAQAEAQTETYADATDDLPAWAIAAARRAWARGETDGLKGKIDPSFPPAPAHVRALALQAMAFPRAEAVRIRRLLTAKVERELSAEHRREMLRRLPALVQTREAPTIETNPPADEMAARLAAMAAEVVRDQETVDSARGGQ